MFSGKKKCLKQIVLEHRSRIAHVAVGEKIKHLSKMLKFETKFPYEPFKLN